MKKRSSNFWKSMTAIFFVIAFSEALVIFNSYRYSTLTSLFTKPQLAPPSSKEDGFEAFEGIAFAREFSERYHTFDSRNFKLTQTAVAFLLEDSARARRLVEIERLQEKIERREVSQTAKLVTLLKLQGLEGRGDRFRAELDIDLKEGFGASPVQSRYRTRLEFSLERAERSEQNPWGFRVSGLIQQVRPSGASEVPQFSTTPTFDLRPGVATLVRFPCSIENVELPKGTPVRVKLTTLDISELQMKTAEPLMSTQTIRAVCRDRVFTMTVRGEDQRSGASEPLVVLQALSMRNATALKSASAKRVRKNPKSGFEKSIEEQLGFVVEEE